jgi:protein phosphatase
MMTDETPRDHDPSDTPTGQIRVPPSLTVEVAGHTDKGRVRPGNEDAYAVEAPTSARARARGTLLLVADGMGGHAAGEVASKLAVETIPDAYYRARGMPVQDAIVDAITRANNAIYASAESDPSRAGMGCTVVAVVVEGDAFTIGHVGDSRGYLIRNGRARQLTRDHSWVAMQVAEGVLTPEQAEHHPNRSLIMRALGRQASVEVDVGHERLQAGDVLLLCSDGLTGVVHDEEIAEYAGRHAPSILAERLVGLANQRGAPDNVTVVIASVGPSADGVSDPSGATTTVVVPPLAPHTDTPTPKRIHLSAEPTTDRQSPLPRVDGRSASNGQSGGRAASKDKRSARAAADGAPLGAPVVISRTSAPARGRGRLLAGAVAAFGLVAALALLIFMRTDSGADNRSTRGTDAPAPALTSASPPAAAPAAPAMTPAPAASSAAIPPPISKELPPAATAPAAPASSPAAVPAATSTPVPASQPTATAAPARPNVVGTFTQLLPTLGVAPPPAVATAVAPTATPTPISESAPGGAAPGAAEARPADAPSTSADATPAAETAPDGTATDSTSPPEAAPPDETAPAAPGRTLPAGVPASVATRIAPRLNGR